MNKVRALITKFDKHDKFVEVKASDVIEALLQLPETNVCAEMVDALNALRISRYGDAIVSFMETVHEVDGKPQILVNPSYLCIVLTKLIEANTGMGYKENTCVMVENNKVVRATYHGPGHTPAYSTELISDSAEMVDMFNILSTISFQKYKVYPNK